MKACGTIMTKDQIEEVKYLEIKDNPEYRGFLSSERREVEDKAIARRQAEISFKAGIKEVVEWLKSYKRDEISCDTWLIPNDAWQFKLKEWGITMTTELDDIIHSCLKCGGECVRDEVDIGVGIQYGPWHCPECGYAQGDDLKAEFPELFKEENSK